MSITPQQYIPVTQLLMIKYILIYIFFKTKPYITAHESLWIKKKKKKRKSKAEIMWLKSNHQ